MHLTSTRPFGVVVFFLSVLTISAQAQPKTVSEEYVQVPVNLSFVPGLSIGESIAGGKKVINRVAINVLAGRAAALHGVEFGGIWNAYTEDVRGVQFGGVVNTVSGTVRGAQFAGVLNLAGGSVRGAQFGGVASITGEQADVQLSGVVSVTGRSVEGVQVGGLASVAGGRVDGVQFSGVVNVAGAPVRGLQFGIVNVAPRVERGVQMGVVNVAEEHSGVPIGLVSYVGETGLRYDVWGNETGMVTVAVRSGNRRVANYFGIGGRPDTDRFRWGTVTGLGVEFATARQMGGLLDLLNYSFFDDASEEDWANLSKVRLLGRFNLSPRVALFGGPTFSALVSDDADGSDLVPWSVYDTEAGNTHVRFGPGVTFGVRLATRAM